MSDKWIKNLGSILIKNTTITIDGMKRKHCGGCGIEISLNHETCNGNDKCSRYKKCGNSYKVDENEIYEMCNFNKLINEEDLIYYSE